MSDDTKNAEPDNPAHPATVENVETATGEDESLREETSREIYDFFRSNRLFFHFGSDKDLSGIRRSEMQPETIFVYMTVPPDGGWGWVIVAISFICNAIIDGVCLTFGRIIPDLTRDLKLDASKTITISSVMNGVYFLVGPVVSAIVNKVGFRPVAMTGGVISAIGIIGGSYCQKWLPLTLCYGFISGWGFGMISAPAVIVVGYYFEKYRALVTGIAICGSGFGTLAFSPIYGLCVQNYGWRNTLRIQAGFCILAAALSFFFRPLLPVKVAQIKEPEPSFGSEFDDEQSVELDFASYSKFLPTRKVDSLETVNETPIIEPTAPMIQHLKKYDPKKYRPENWLVTKFKDFICCKKKEEVQKPIPESSRRDLNLVLESRPLFRRDIFYPGSITNLPEFQQGEGSLRSVSRPAPDDQAGRINYNISMMHPPRASRAKVHKHLQISSVIFQGLTLLLDVKLFAFPTFRLLVLACFFFVVGSNIPYIFITVRGDKNGIPHHLTNWFISVIGVSNTVFRVLAGFVSFLPVFDPTYLSAAFLFVSGFFTFISGFIGQGNAGFQYFYCTVFGVGSAFFNTLKQVIFVRCLGLNNLTNAFGITSLVMGLATLIGMPISGVLMDATGNADATFMYAGISIIVAGALQSLVPLSFKHQQAKKEREARAAKKLQFEKTKKNRRKS